MNRHRLRMISLCLVCLALPAVLSAAEATTPAAVSLAQSRDVQEALALAGRIDQHVAASWQEKSITPAQPADDAEFLRRVYLDLAGRIPPVPEVRRFLDDKRPDKRLHLVEELLNSALYVNNFTNTWKALLLPQNNNPQLQFFAQNFDAWMRKQVRDNVRYDQLVRELLTVPITNAGRAPRPTPNSPGEPSPVVFYQANELKAENLAASTSRLFLGVKLECAQCHDHPFATWTRKQFWEFAAFFSGIRPLNPNNAFNAAPELANQREIKIPNTEKTVQARFLAGDEPPWKDGVSSRATLADWLTAAENPFFARNLVNRMWAHFFGIGLTEPVDEPSDDNPPSHPELLDELARAFAERQFDMKFLLRAIVLSKAYQLSSIATHPTQEEPRLFARMAVKGMTGEQLFDSLAQAIGYIEPPQVNQRVAFGANTPRGEFLTRFASQDKRTEYQTSILQALALMNGRLVGDFTDASNLERTRVLAVAIDFPFFDTPAKKVEMLYLSTLSRTPRADELERMVKYVESGGPKKDEKAALADVFWALLNSSEFILNH